MFTEVASHFGVLETQCIFIFKVSVIQAIDIFLLYPVQTAKISNRSFETLNQTILVLTGQMRSCCPSPRSGSSVRKLAPVFGLAVESRRLNLLCRLHSVFHFQFCGCSCHVGSGLLSHAHNRINKRQGSSNVDTISFSESFWVAPLLFN